MPLHHPIAFQMTNNKSNSNTKASSLSSTSLSSSSSNVNESNTNENKAGVYYKSKQNIKKESNIKQKKLLLIRHGTSLANEFMDRPGNRWGDKTFTDDMSLVDASLSQTGISQANILQRTLSNRFVLPKVVDDNGNSDSNNMGDVASDVIQVDDNLLVVTSPLRRCIETMTIGVLPNLLLTNDCNSNNTKNDNDNDDEKKEDNSKSFKIVVQPLARERVYTASDTGRPISELEKDYPHLDFVTCFQSPIDQNSWWYTHDKNSTTPYQEWRPFGDGQFYAVPGEPIGEFNERMVQLFHWIESREEQTIILVCHWGVIRWFTGEDVKNCHVKELNFDNLVLKDVTLQSFL